MVYMIGLCYCPPIHLSPEVSNMACRILGTTIFLTRGDTLRVPVVIKKGSDDYIPQDSETIRFALKRPCKNCTGDDYFEQEPLISKEIPVDTMILELTPGDTKELGFGTYVYDVSITLSDGSVDTFIPCSSLVLTEDVG